MQLRKLKEKDAQLVLEWMHDPDVNCFFRFDPEKVSIDTVKCFIQQAQQTNENLHLACVDEDDNYLGTISLKHIDKENKSAEYAISFRKKAQGKGAAGFATKEILKIAFEKLDLIRVYLNVLEENEHAWKFYEHMGFICEEPAQSEVIINNCPKNLKWYALLKENYNE